MAFFTARVPSGSFVTVPPGVSVLVRAITYMDTTSGNFWGVGRGPGIAQTGVTDLTALTTVDNPGYTVANGGGITPVAAEIGAPVLVGQRIYCIGDSATFLIFG